MQSLFLILAALWCAAPLPFTPVLAAERLSPAQSADALIEAGHYKRAREAVARRLRENPADAYAHFLDSKIKQGFGDLPGAVAAAERALALEPHVSGKRGADFHGQLAEVYAYTADRSSWVRAIGLARMMKKEIGAALALQPHHTDTLLVQMMFSLKAPAVAGGDRKKARAIAAEIVEHDPAWGYLAQARLGQGSASDPALEGLLKQAVRADSSHYRAWLELANFYCCESQRPNLAAAEEASRQLLALDPGRAGAYNVLARVYAGAARWSDLDSLLARAEQSVPDDLAPFYFAARALADQKQESRRAARYLEKYISQEAEGREPPRAQAQKDLQRLL